MERCPFLEVKMYRYNRKTFVVYSEVPLIIVVSVL